MTALQEYNLANEVVVTRDGKEALDYLFRREEFAHRSNENPAVMLLDLKIPKIDGLEVLQTDQVGRAAQAASRRGVDLIPRGAGHDKKLSPRRERHVVKPVDFHEFVNPVRELGLFWAVINEPPPGSANR